MCKAAAPVFRKRGGYKYMVTPAGVKHKRVARGNGIVTFRQPEVTPGFIKCNAVFRKSPGKPCGGAIGHTHRIKGKQPSAAAYDRTGADRAFARVGYRYGKRVFCPMLEITRGYVRPLMCAQPPFAPVVAAMTFTSSLRLAPVTLYFTCIAFTSVFACFLCLSACIYITLKPGNSKQIKDFPP